MSRSSTGLDENLACLLCYALGWLTGLIFMLIEKDSAEVQFHARQSLFCFGGLALITMMAPTIPLLGPLVAGAGGVITVVLWLLMMVKGYQNDHFKLPIVGDLAEQNS